MAAPSLLHRLQERKLVQWGVAYLAGAWALVEATNLVVDQFHWPEILGQAVTVAAFFGFFVTAGPRLVPWVEGPSAGLRSRAGRVDARGGVGLQGRLGRYAPRV